MARLATLSLIALAACKTAAAPPPPPPPAPTKPQPVVQKPAPPACDANGAAQCLASAEKMSEREPARAEKELELCLECSAAPSAAHRLLATLIADRGDKARARDVLRRGVRAHPNSDMLWIALARAELDLGRTREAMSAYSSARRLRPEDEALAREQEDALARHGSSLDRADAEVQVLLREATGRAELDDFTGARDTLVVALQKANAHPHLAALVRHRLAMVYLQLRQPKLAHDELERVLAIEKQPSVLRGEALLTACEALLALGKPVEAIRAAKDAIALEPKSTLAHANLAIALAVGGDTNASIDALKTAFELGLARKLTMAEFLAIGPAIDSLKKHPSFASLVKNAWPNAKYP